MAYNTVKVKKYSDNVEEAPAASAITPGQLVEITAFGKAQAHSTAGGDCLVKVALEDELQGNGIDDDYSADDAVQIWVPAPGDMFYGLLKDGEAVSIGTFVESAGDGDVREVTSGGKAIGIAMEALDLSGSSAADPSSRRVLIQVL